MCPIFGRARLSGTTGVAALRRELLGVPFTLLSQQGLTLGLRRADYEGAIDALNRALDIARREGDLNLEMWTLARIGRVEFFFLRYEECIAKDGQTMELNRRVGDPDISAFSGLCVVGAQMSVGDSEGARSNLEAMLATTENARFRIGIVTALWSSAMFHLAVGNWDQAREATERGLGLNPVNTGLLDARVSLEYGIGDFQEGANYLDRVVDIIRANPPGSIYSHIAVIIAKMTAGTDLSEHIKSAEDAARILLCSPTTTPLYSTEANIALALIAVMQSDIEGATAQYPVIKPLEGTLQDHTMMSMDRLLGLLAHTMGNFDDSAGHFEDALAFCRKAGYRPELAWSLCHYADMLLDPSTSSGRTDKDREKAVAMLDESLAISTELGMRPLMERVLSRREILNA